MRKIEQLLNTGAKVTVVAPEIHPGIKRLLEADRCVWLCRKYKAEEAGFYRLVIATTDDAECNRRIFDDCQNAGIPVNVVDQPELCTVIFPSVARRGFFTMAISSGGKTPFATKALRRKLEAFLEDILILDKPELLIKFREFVRERTDDPEVKGKAYERLLSCSREEWSQWSEDEPPYEVWSQWIKELNG